MKSLFICALAAILLAGCSRESKIRSLEDHELAQRYAECLDRKPTAPGKVQACENLRKECEKRRQDLGSFICRTY